MESLWDLGFGQALIAAWSILWNPPRILPSPSWNWSILVCESGAASPVGEKENDKSEVGNQGRPQSIETLSQVTLIEGTLLMQ